MRFGSVWFGRLFVVSVVAVFVAATVAVIVSSAGSGGGPPIALLLFWLVAIAWNAYWWLFRLAMELRIEDSVLLTSAPLRSRRIELSSLTAIRPLRLASNIAVVEVMGEPPVLTFVTAGFRDFTAGIAKRRPSLPIRFTWLTNPVEPGAPAGLGRDERG